MYHYLKTNFVSVWQFFVKMSAILARFNEYLSQSTIHGLPYFSNARSNFERVLWILAVLTSLTLACYMIQTSLHEVKINPIATNIEMIPIEKVPFPAITINADLDADPWGFIEKSFNMLAFDIASEKYEEKAKKLRQDFRFLTYDVIRKMYEHLYHKKLNEKWSVEDFKDYRTKEYAPSPIRVRNYSVFSFMCLIFRFLKNCDFSFEGSAACLF